MKKFTKTQIKLILDSAKKLNITDIIDGSEVDAIFEDINQILGGYDIIDILNGFDRPNNNS